MSNSNLINNTAKIFGGSAIAGMGFAFGRDIYSNTKKRKDSILALAILGFAIVGAYSGGIMMARNYKSLWSGIFHRLGGIVILVPSFVILALMAAMIIPGDRSEVSASEEPHKEQNVEVRRALPASDDIQVDEYTSTNSTVEVRRALPVSSSTIDEEPIKEPAKEKPKSQEDSSFNFPLSILIFPLLVFSVGFIVGLSQRQKRKDIWDSEASNRSFMKNRNLFEAEDSTIEDAQTGQSYRIEHMGRDRITLFPIGRRGKRAYIFIDNNGRYLDYTGMVKV